MWILLLPLIVSFAILIGIWYYTVFSDADDWDGEDEWGEEDDYLDNDDWIGH